MLRVCLVMILLGTAAGCGANPEAKTLPDTVPVSGVVTWNGQPLSAATVTFIPQGQTVGTECQGKTDESGEYKLTQQHGGDGAPPGDYKVVISLLLRGDGTPLPPEGVGEGAGAGGIAVESLPRQYSDISATKLTAIVPPVGGEFKFELQGKKNAD
ncbi:MAG: carboxypeptidase regulatory-like domain-containing protein [Planctomycetota bacterium]|jgi:hypothetical protein|uniref:carboxypeptidase regulatory-like domain-containing protein n=1 Tax=uncultured Gimesia sp. TaxID=1678688 RepID=UPI002632C3C7|nr:carboxypeptidase regulatory-like domain-containing protein [uncultured Gimesia sp.]